MARSLRVLFLLTQSLDYPSGLGRYWPVARYMAQLGHQVEIAALHPEFAGLRRRTAVCEGVTISYVGQMHVRQVGSRRYYFSPAQLLRVTASATVALLKAALARRRDRIHIAKAQPMNGLAGWLAARLQRSKLYLDCDDYEAASNAFGSEWQRAVVAWWEDHLPPASRGVTVNTTFLRDRCVRLGVSVDHVRRIPNGFDPDRFRAVSDLEREAIRRRWGLAGHPIILYVGSLSLKSHPILLLLDAFIAVHQRLPEARLWLVGGGEDVDRVVNAVQQRGLEQAVILSGHVDAALVPGILAAGHVLVDPVCDDAVARARSPLKIVESLAAGVPVVTGHVGDRAFMLDGGRAGLLVEPGRAAALAEGMLTLLEDPALRQRLATHATELRHHFRWDRLVRDFVQIYAL